MIILYSSKASKLNMSVKAIIDVLILKSLKGIIDYLDNEIVKMSKLDKMVWIFMKCAMFIKRDYHEILIFQYSRGVYT